MQCCHQVSLITIFSAQKVLTVGDGKITICEPNVYDDEPSSMMVMTMLTGKCLHDDYDNNDDNADDHAEDYDDDDDNADRTLSAFPTNQQVV